MKINFFLVNSEVKMQTGCNIYTCPVTWQQPPTRTRTRRHRPGRIHTAGESSSETTTGLDSVLLRSRKWISPSKGWNTVTGLLQLAGSLLATVISVSSGSFNEVKWAKGGTCHLKCITLRPSANFRPEAKDYLPQDAMITVLLLCDTSDVICVPSNTFPLA